MQTKTSVLKDYMQAGEWDKALSLAAKFPQLGEHKDAIVRGHEANVHSSFYAQLGKNPDQMRSAGIEALKQRYAKLI